MSKKWVIIAMIVLLASISCKATKSEGNWTEDYTAAVQKAKDTDKTILINFTGSDWCGWCMKLSKEVFTQPEFQEYATGNLILFKADFPNKIKQTEQLKTQNQALAKKYNIEGFPTILLLDKDEQVLGQTGYQYGGAKSYVQHLKGFIEKQ
ncbi:MAG: thioredoxin family protein [Candidatus Cloacimonetes bacterium]|nr:thioredoxin family protein [Candidatus Cloacimonadota bacterium]